MPAEALVVFSDAHLGYAPPETETALLEFLDRVPEIGDALLVNGDLFEFWFAYEQVIPRGGFRVAAALGRLARRVPVAMVGGNHDRWGRPFWERELGVRFARDRLELAVGARRVIALHGDAVSYGRARSRALHGLVRLPVTSTLYRALHPELGVPLVRWLAGRLGDHALAGDTVDRGAALQREWAERLLAADPSVGLLILGHTHRAALTEPAPGRQYLNPGAWFDGFRYAVATGSGAELRQFTPSEPLRRPSAGRR
ncbi:MAG TPA: UDP-2,3-diacylglucosamine diphosphatase [Gemmatimonadales bacterium]|nr:UDP-2,3-diacylglucosamine diphosphatase [Gemmatimonadales bacterium]